MNKEQTIDLFRQGKNAWNSWVLQANKNATADFQGHVFQEEYVGSVDI